MIINTDKFICESCNFSCIFQSSWEQHIFTEKHKNNGKIIREKKTKTLKTIFKCSCCDFLASHNDGLTNHYLSKHASIDEKEKEFTYYCKICDFGTFYEKVYNKHCESKKHIMTNKYLNNQITKIQDNLSSECST
jgi:hypothetical protein